MREDFTAVISKAFYLSHCVCHHRLLLPYLHSTDSQMTRKALTFKAAASFIQNSNKLTYQLLFKILENRNL